MILFILGFILGLLVAAVVAWERRDAALMRLHDFRRDQELKRFSVPMDFPFPMNADTKSIVSPLPESPEPTLSMTPRPIGPPCAICNGTGQLYMSAPGTFAPCSCVAPREGERPPKQERLNIEIIGPTERGDE